MSEEKHEMIKNLAKEKGITFNEYMIQLIDRDLTDNLWINVEDRINGKITLLSKIMEEQTKEYINTKSLLMATIDVLLESMNVEVDDFDEEKN